MQENATVNTSPKTLIFLQQVSICFSELHACLWNNLRESSRTLHFLGMTQTFFAFSLGRSLVARCIWDSGSNPDCILR